MSIYKSFVKTFGPFKVRLSEPHPRRLEVTNTRENCRLFGLDLEEARDLHYALGRLIAQADEDDTKGKK